MSSITEQFNAFPIDSLKWDDMQSHSNSEISGSIWSNHDRSIPNFSPKTRFGHQSISPVRSSSKYGIGNGCPHV
ncbi:hypothetical protein AMATHDRAFT_65357 [Amanita thiersii Skay4041]|uniref:Uncharacterized protein n=1 Tax=Amanita thiersii Skay4041 TaxID=703135 RepID=A0A2A9NJT0_9AGAR|nr:hypothetical protein AMATHDRAFT_65357 [Amanita thiersii Skay4041]